ncbi:MAG: hypothetical protein J0L93_09490 [Deltaproteobacteria bacterium]|nr:hypothetical protein [Deltaproteobacteria bacterium]
MNWINKILVMGGLFYSTSYALELSPSQTKDFCRSLVISLAHDRFADQPFGSRFRQDHSSLFKEDKYKNHVVIRGSAEAELFWSFESDIFNFITEIPAPLRSLGSKNLKDFAEKYFLSEREVLDLVHFYGRMLFGSEVQNRELIGKSEEIAETFEAYQKILYLTESNSAAVERYGYYAVNLGRKSVREMADELVITQGEVYQDLSILNLSLHNRYQKLLSNLSEKSILNPSYEDFKREFGMTPDAYEFMNHALGVENRGESWSRFGDWSSFRMPEDEILVELHGMELTTAEIAEHLNQIFKDNQRTEASVAARLHLLRLTEAARPRPKNVEISPYGFVKKNGLLQLEVVRDIIDDHPASSLSFFADQFQVSADGLRKFLIRNHLRSTRAIESAQLASPEIETIRKRHKILMSEAEEKWAKDFAAENGGIQILKEIAAERFSTKNGAQKTFIELLDGLSDETKEETIQQIKRLGFRTSDGSDAQQDYLHAQKRIAAGIKIVIEAHRRSGISFPAEIPTNREDFAQSIQNMPLVKKIKWAINFSSQNGGIKVLQEIAEEIFTLNNGAKKALLQLLEGLPEVEKKAAVDQIDRLELKTYDGNNAQLGWISSQKRIAEGVQIVIDAHRKNGLSLADEIPSDQMAFSLFIQNLPYIKWIQWAKDFAAKDGGVRVLQEIITDSFSRNEGAKKVLLQLLEGLSDKIKEEAIQQINQLDFKASDGRISQYGQLSAQKRIAAGINIVIAAHRKNGLSLPDKIPSDQMAFSLFIENLPYIKWIQWAKDFAAKDGGIRALQEIADEGFFENSGAKKAILQLLEGIPEKIKAETFQQVNSLDLKSHDGDNSQQGHLTAQKRIAAGIKIVIEAHKKAGKKFPAEIPSDKEGFREIIRIIQEPVAPE